MTDQQQGPDGDQPDEQDFDEIAADLALDAKKSHKQNKQEQQEFLDTVSEEEGADVLETQCNIMGDYVVPLRAKLNGDLMDAMGRIDARLERLENEEGRAYEFSETADEASQLLADAIDDPEWHKAKFYAAYENEGLKPLGVMLNRVFTNLKEERERRRGVSDGFRKEH